MNETKQDMIQGVRMRRLPSLSSPGPLEVVGPGVPCTTNGKQSVTRSTPDARHRKNDKATRQLYNERNGFESPRQSCEHAFVR